MIEQRRQEDIEKANTLAQELHKKQFRKHTKIPYYEHLAGVAGLIKLGGGNDTQIIAGLLHDSIEDQGDKITIEEIKNLFGSEVATLVMDCTHEDTDEGYRVHKQRPMDKIASGNISLYSNLVITCDKLYNAESIVRDYVLIGDKLWDRFNGDKSDVVWYYTGMYKALRSVAPSGSNPMLDRLERAVRVLNSF